MNIGIKPLTYVEMEACAKAVANESGMSDATCRDVVKVTLGAFYRERFGPAPGSVATITKTGQTAVRFYNVAESSYGWQVNPTPDSPTDVVTYAEELPNVPGQVWHLAERPWWELVYSGAANHA